MTVGRERGTKHGPGRGDVEHPEWSLTDPEAFAALFYRHAPAINRYVRRRLGAAEAEDVVADTFVTAFARRHRFDAERGDVRPWLYGLASQHIRNHRRAELRAYRALARLGADPLTEEFADRVEDRAVAQAAGPKLAAALARMSGQHRDVLLLVAWADLSYEEVAEALDVPLGTVRSRLHRARKTIRAALGDAEPDLNTEERDHG